MNDLVKNSIDSRKNGIYYSYNITDQKLIEKIDDLFRRIYEFGENCTDNMDFENKFASSNLNAEYIQLFTEIATTCSPIVRENVEPRPVKSDEEYILEDIESEIRYQTRNATEPIRRQMRQEAYETARDMPVIGDILNVKQHVDLFNKFKKKKKDEEDEENIEGNKKHS